MSEDFVTKIVIVAIILFPTTLFVAGVVSNLWRCYFWLHKKCHYSLKEIKWRKAFYPSDERIYNSISGYVYLSFAYTIITAYAMVAVCLGIAYLI